MQGAALINRKLLKAQLARHGKADWSESDAAFDEIVAMTGRYNTEKWKGIMSWGPRGLAVYQKVPHESIDAPLEADPSVLATLNAAEGKGNTTLCEGLGYAEGAAIVPAGSSLEFNFKAEAESVLVSVRLVPSHPVSGGKLRFNLSLDGKETGETAYETYDRSEEWKVNVLWNQAVREFTMPLASGKNHKIVFTSLDEGVILDQIQILELKPSS